MANRRHWRDTNTIFGGNVEVEDNLTAANYYSNAGAPTSGPTGTGNGVVEANAVLQDKTNGVLYINEGTQLSPYWTPVSFDQPGILGARTDFKELRADILSGATPAITDTGTVNYLGSGVRVLGQGIAENDSGIAAGTDVEGSNVARLTTTDEDAHTIGLSSTGTVAKYQPDAHGTLVVDIELTNVSAITTRSLFVGFVGAAADALDPVVTGATTTATFAIDDLAGIYQDTDLTDGDGLMLVSEKSNTAGTQTSLSAADDLAAAGTYQRFRVEVASDGTATAFLDKALLGVIPGATAAATHSATEEALDADEELIPVAYLEATSAANVSADVKQFAYWGTR